MVNVLEALWDGNIRPCRRGDNQRHADRQDRSLAAAVQDVDDAPVENAAVGGRLLQGNHEKVEGVVPRQNIEHDIHGHDQQKRHDRQEQAAARHPFPE